MYVKDIKQDKKRELATRWRESGRHRLPSLRYNCKRYSITLEQYNDLLREQDNKCAICRSLIISAIDPLYTGGKPSNLVNIDHDHKTNRVRGLLCNACNLGIGKLQDNPNIIKEAARYVRRNGGPEPTTNYFNFSE